MQFVILGSHMYVFMYELACFKGHVLQEADDISICVVCMCVHVWTVAKPLTASASEDM